MGTAPFRIRHLEEARLRQGAQRALLWGLRWGLQLRFWVALCVAAQARFVESVILGESDAEVAHSLASPPSLAVAFVFWCTLGLYNLDGTLDAARQERTPGLRRAHWSLTLISGGAVTFLGSRASPAFVAVALPGLIVCAFYAVRLVIKGREFGIKQIPYFKAPFVGGAVGSATVWIPWSAREAPSAVTPGELIALWCALCFACFANALLFDLPDESLDRRTGVPTLAAKHGLSATRSIAGAAAGAGSLAALFAPLPARASLLLLSAALIVATGRVTHETQKTTLAFWVDGALLIPLLTCIWA